MERGENMNKQALVDAVASELKGTKAEATAAIEAVLEGIENILKTDSKLALVGFGNFTVKQRPERQGRNPLTGAAITIAAKKVIGFKAGKSLSDSVQ